MALAKNATPPPTTIDNHYNPKKGHKPTDQPLKTQFTTPNHRIKHKPRPTNLTIRTHKPMMLEHPQPHTMVHLG